MRNTFVPVAFIVLFLQSGFLIAEPAKVFRAGAATSEITSPLGAAIVGGFVPFPATRIHDELNARCLVLDDGSTKLAIVVCDLLGIARQVSDEARLRIEKELGIPKSHILISATHTHSAGSALGSNPRAIKQTLDNYQELVAKRIVDGVRKANNNLRPAEIAIGNVDVPEHVFNRRWYLKDGKMPANPFGTFDKVKMNPGAGNPDLVEPAGPTDPGIRFISVREPNGNMISIFSTYSLHYIGGVGNGDVSSDYYGAYCNRLLEMVGNKNSKTPFVAMMANGTSGDINNINFRTPRGRQMPYEQIQFVANDVATKVADAAKKLNYQSYVSLDARYREPLIGLRKPTPNDLAWATETLADKSKDPAKGNLSAIYAQRVNGMKDYPEQAPMPLQVFRIGNHTIGTMPCEVFCEIGLDYKNKTSQNTGWMVSLAHGYYGYLPTPRHHELGGYETWIGTNRLEKMASDKMLAQLFEMTTELKPGQAAEAPEPARRRKLLGRKLFHR